jgi:hypothetical protein
MKLPVLSSEDKKNVSIPLVVKSNLENHARRMTE